MRANKSLAIVTSDAVATTHRASKFSVDDFCGEFMLESVPTFDYHREIKSARTKLSLAEIADSVERSRGLTVVGEADTVAHEELDLSSTPRWGKNDQCFCGSGEKFSRCHGIAIYW